jgi:hypothetical protein
VVVWTISHIASHSQRRHEDAATDLTLPVGVRNVLHQEVTAPNFDVVSFVPEALQIRTTTYQSL